MNKSNNNLYTRSTDETKDEPYAWEAREFLRRKLIGQDVTFAIEKSVNTARTYGTVWLGKGIYRSQTAVHLLELEN